MEGQSSWSASASSIVRSFRFRSSSERRPGPKRGSNFWNWTSVVPNDGERLGLGAVEAGHERDHPDDRPDADDDADHREERAQLVRAEGRQREPQVLGDDAAERLEDVRHDASTHTAARRSASGGSP